MKPVFYLAALLATLLSGCGGGGTASPTVEGSKWTVLVYMAADNNLDVSAPLDLSGMQAVGSSANVNVIVEYDTRSTPTQIYKIEKNGRTLLKDLGEQDMATPECLRDFIVYGMTSHPADHYALVIWSHGEGWTPGSDSAPLIQKAVIVDANNTNLKPLPMANTSVAQGILAAEALTGAKIDILGFDACLMATLEAAYEFRSVADIMVSSQDQVQGYGWDYQDLLGRITRNPLMTPKEFSAAMVTSFKNFVESPAWGYGDQTISAIELGSGMEALAQAVGATATAFKAKMDNVDTRYATVAAIATARASAQEIYPPTYVDLVDFTAKLYGAGVDNPAQAALENITIAEYHGSKRPGAHGLSIVFFDLPVAKSYSVYDPNYRNYDAVTGGGSTSSFINGFTWDEFMRTYFSYEYPDISI